MVENKKVKIISKTLVYLIMTVITFMCIFPFLVVLSASFSSESELVMKGYSLLPRGFTTLAYKVIISDPTQLVSAYGVTIFVTVVGSVLSILTMALAAYPLSRSSFKWRKYISFYFYFTTIFSGGAVSTYIWISQGMNLKNNILVLFLPILVSAWNVFLLRTYFAQIPSSLVEAAKIDGANEYYIFFRIIVPMSTVGIATVLVMVSLNYWNDWYHCMMYMTKDKYISLQYYLYRVMSEIESMKNMSNVVLQKEVDLSSLPGETARMAMCILAAGPMVFVFSFFQKYFVRGIALGSVKG